MEKRYGYQIRAAKTLSDSVETLKSWDCHVH